MGQELSIFQYPKRMSQIMKYNSDMMPSVAAEKSFIKLVPELDRSLHHVQGRLGRLPVHLHVPVRTKLWLRELHRRTGQLILDHSTRYGPLSLLNIF